MTELNPRVVASIDQAAALLRDLTDDARRHHHTVRCAEPSACVGSAALGRMRTHFSQLDRVLTLAIAERAATTAGPTRADVAQVIADALTRCWTARLMAAVDGAGLDEGADFWSASDASAVVDALATIGALRVGEDRG